MVILHRQTNIAVDDLQIPEELIPDLQARVTEGERAQREVEDFATFLTSTRT